ncbi:hypothetical protein, partial [Streptomyces sp. Wh19]|uniref:hypothetical protein n=1 Tax=Streptomyces sp. Wh19 TaxID=3076629 RepID=UPI003FA38363
PGDHSVAGEVIARDTAARIGFDQHDVGVVATLVRHHLLLVETATRRDLDDPATTPWPARSSPGTRPPGSASTSTTWASSPPSYATICCSSRP